MSLVNSNISYTGLVEKYIGSAYDTVKYVADNLEGLQDIINFINSDDYPDIVELSKLIEEYLQGIEDFNNTYYGPLSADPTVDPSGGPITAGDLYYSTSDGHLRSYNGTSWTRIGVVTQTSQRVVVTADMVSGAWTTINTQDTYVLSANNLSVHVGGAYLSENGDYEEINITSFRIDSTLAPVGSTVDISIGSDVANVQHMVDVSLYRILTVGANQQVITLPAGVTYIPGTHNLEVMQDRRLLLKGLDYEELDPTSITLYVAVPDNTEILMKIGHITGTVPNSSMPIMQDTVPILSAYQQGQRWFNTATSRYYILYIDIDSAQWVSLNGEEEIIPAVAP